VIDEGLLPMNSIVQVAPGRRQSRRSGLQSPGSRSTPAPGEAAGEADELGERNSEAWLGGRGASDPEGNLVLGELLFFGKGTGKRERAFS